MELIFLIIGLLIGVFIMCLVQINKKECLHCGKGYPDYCEKCYQDLISKNAKLQSNYKESVKREIHIKKVIERNNRYIKDLEYIKDCYYKEIAEREKNKKIFRLDKPDKPVSESEKMEVIINEMKRVHREKGGVNND